MCHVKLQARPVAGPALTTRKQHLFRVLRGHALLQPAILTWQGVPGVFCRVTSAMQAWFEGHPWVGRAWHAMVQD